MKLKLKYCLIIAIQLLACLLVPAQTAVERQVINSTGANGNAGANFFVEYSVGEPVIATGSTGSNNFTMGFLQPDMTITGVFSLNVYTSNESCVASQDAYISVTPQYALGHVTYLWSPGGDTTSMIKNLLPGIYILTAIDTAGHSVVDTFNIMSSTTPCDLDTIYNGLSPNGDGKNDVFIIPDISGYTDNAVYIYNRYGTEVWSGSGYDNTSTVFSGKDKNGIELPEGTYFYIINYGGKQKRNWIELLR